ncbi:intermembrane lipid transfer protein VPS13D-like [Crassostrea virginica]
MGSRGPRIQLEINANSPIIIFPNSSMSTDVLVVNLGKLTVNNCFIEDGKAGTLTCNQAQTLRSGKKCLLDVIQLTLKDMELFSAQRINRDRSDETKKNLDFNSFLVQRQDGSFLKEKIQLKLTIEKNLDRYVSHSAPDFRSKLSLSSVHFNLDVSQYKLVQGILSYNIGEKLPLFSQPTVSSTEVRQNNTLIMTVDLKNVTVELLSNSNGCSAQSLATLDFICSTYTFDSFSYHSKNISLNCQTIRMSDTRFRDVPVNHRPNVFEKILQPGPQASPPHKMQLVINYKSAPEINKFTFILHNMKVMCIFDWIFSVRDFIMERPKDPFIHEKEAACGVVEDTFSEVSSLGQTRETTTIPQRNKVEVPFEMKLNVSDTQFIVVDDTTTLDANAVILKSTAYLKYCPSDNQLSCILDSLEVFSCSMAAEEETAQSIIDPLTININSQDANEFSQHSVHHGQKENFNLKVNSEKVCICLIDDCGDSDVPLVEIAVQSIEFSHQFQPQHEGNGSFVLSSDYYNRTISGWEPFVEHWRCCCKWNQNSEKQTKVKINAEDILNLSVSKTLLDLYDQTIKNWSDDYQRQTVKRKPFVPFKLANETGCTLCFKKVTILPNENQKANKKYKNMQRGECNTGQGDWIKVESGEMVPFSFYDKEKNRHEKTHVLHINQLIVKVNEWEVLPNVSVDCVGVYFRHADPDISLSEGKTQMQARVVFDVKPEGNARKLITVRSALVVRNELDSSIELKMQIDERYISEKEVRIPAKSSFPIPLAFVSSSLYIRPYDQPVRYCDEPIKWNHVKLAGDVKGTIIKCAYSEGKEVYRFCMLVKRENYPDQLLTEDVSNILPGHTLSVCPPVIVCNLLPVELQYYINDMPIKKVVKAQGKSCIHTVDTSNVMRFGLNLETFPTCHEIEISPWKADNKPQSKEIRLYDTKERLLNLLIRIIFQREGSIYDITKEGYKEVSPQQEVFFHWTNDKPKVKKLMCVKLLDNGRHFWSGGFDINKRCSFDINIRNEAGESHLLHVEILQNTVAYTIVIGDAVPPPYRFDNLSEDETKINSNQLWTMTSQGVIETKASYSIIGTQTAKSSNANEKSMVLDIDTTSHCETWPLILGRRDEKRNVTQTWAFTKDGRLSCARGTLYVQHLLNKENINIHKNSEMVGPGPLHKQIVPAYMRIDQERLFPERVILAIRTVMEGPIRVLQIKDISVGRDTEDNENKQDLVSDEDERTKMEMHTQNSKTTLKLSIKLKGGLGVSLVNSTPEELIYISLRDISVKYIFNTNSTTTDISVANVQVDNQLPAARLPVLLYIVPNTEERSKNTHALHIKASCQRNTDPNWNIKTFKYLIINIHDLRIQIEERLAWKLVQFFGFGSADQLELRTPAIDAGNIPEDPVAATYIQSKKYYFEELQICNKDIYLSILSTFNLSPDLQAIKSEMLSLPLHVFSFEDEKLEPAPFTKECLCKPMDILLKDISSHYKEEVVKISVILAANYFGDLKGWYRDIEEGISDLRFKGKLLSPLRNFNHGLWNFVAKVTGNVSDGLGILNMDSNYQVRREQIKTRARLSNKHMLAGAAKNFGFGLLGAVTSIFTQPYDGYQEEGLKGFVTGIGKGLIGTVTKPVVGALDLVSGATNVIKDTGSRISGISPLQVRLPRCCRGARMLLPPYSYIQARSQKLFHDLNKKTLGEFFFSVEQLAQEYDNEAIITSNQVLFLKCGKLVFSVPYPDFKLCFVVESDDGTYRLKMRGPEKEFQVQYLVFETREVPDMVSQQINYARNLYEELQHTLT